MLKQLTSDLDRRWLLLLKEATPCCGLGTSWWAWRACVIFGSLAQWLHHL